MGFLDDVKTINPINPTQDNSGGFLGGVRDQTEHERKKQVFAGEAALADNLSKQMNSFGTILKETVVGTGETLKNAGESFVTNTWNTYKNTPHLLWEDITSAADDIAKGRGFTGVFKAGIRTAGDVATAIFAPISAALGATLEATGGQKLIDSTGQVIADKSGITDLPAFQRFAAQHPHAAEDFNRIMMLVMSKAETDPIKLKELPGEINKFVTNITDMAKPEPTKATVKSETPGEAKVNVSTPQTRYQEYLKSQGYEPYTPNGELPTIDMGKPAKDSLPVIQTGESIRVSKNANGDYVYEPISNKIEPTVTPKTEVAPTTEVKPTTETPIQQLPANKVVSSQAQEIARTLDTDFNIQVSPEDLATYKTKEGFMADQAQKALNLAKENPADFKAISLGEKNATGGLTNESVFAAAKKMAYDAGDAQALLDLAKSKVITKASIKGQEIKSLDTADPNITDPVKLIQDINSAYEKNYQKIKGENYATSSEKVMKEMKDSVKSKAPTKASWEDFINNIKCNY